MAEIDKERLLRHIAKSDLTAVEKRYMEGLVGAEDCNKDDNKVQIVTELNPCPFCGSTTAPTVMNQNEAQWLDNDAENLSMVVCCAAKKFGCGASTGFCDTAEQAVEAWNRRASDWIPCIERLPNVDGNYVVMRGNAAEILEYSVEMESFGYTDEYKDELGYNITEWYTVGGVSDWMPIPPKEGGDHDA